MTCRVFVNTNPATKGRYPYLMEQQHPHMAILDSRLVAPVAEVGRPWAVNITGLTPTIRIEGNPYRVLIPMLASVPMTVLGAEITDKRLDRVEIQAAVDRLLTGF
jgi:toxin CcdB